MHGGDCVVEPEVTRSKLEQGERAVSRAPDRFRRAWDARDGTATAIRVKPLRAALNCELGCRAADQVRGQCSAVVDRKLEGADRGTALAVGQRARSGEYPPAIVSHGAGHGINLVVVESR